MAINFRTPEMKELRPRITVLGVGGAGGNAVNNMIASRLEGVDFVVANTDAQSIAQSKAERKIQMGVRVTEGLGAGAQPDIGRAGAEESLEEILEQLSGAHMVFITAGMGGGTGTGAAPVIARAVRELGILTVGVVTKPFAFEGDKRMRIAERGILELQNYVHTLIVIPNQNLFRVANDRTTFAQAFTMADEVLHCGVRGVTDLIVMPGLINLDFADIKSVISEMGKAMMGTGEAEGEDRAIKAADSAICNPLLEDVSMKGARGVLINITGGPDLMLFEVEQAANRVRAEVDPDANIIFGNTILDNMEGRIRVSVVATGIDADEMRKLPENVERLRLNAKSPPLRHEGARPAPLIAQTRAPISNPVHKQVETLVQELRVESPVTTMSAPVLSEFSDMEESSSPVPFQIAEPVPTRGSIADAKLEPIRMPAETERRGMFGWGWKKPAERAEPAASTSHPVVETFRSPSLQSETVSSQQSAANLTTDLFPDQQQDEKFEIPAFLRRQTN